MFTLTSFRFFSSAIFSSTGATAWHGPHHSAQKSTSTGSPDWRTSWSKVVSVTSVAIQLFLSRVPEEENVALYTSVPVFEPLPKVPDHPAVEEEVLAWWEAEDIFGKLRARNDGGPTFSFVGGPVAANKSLAVHTAWGRTLKDGFQRYKALQGFDQRYQNGFDCQGLWIEVGVEHDLGLNSKREIEEVGLEEFARKCR